MWMHAVQYSTNCNPRHYDILHIPPSTSNHLSQPCRRSSVAVPSDVVGQPTIAVALRICICICCATGRPRGMSMSGTLHLPRVHRPVTSVDQ